MKPSKVRLGMETALAVAALTLGMVTAFWHDWIEALTSWDPDQHSGSMEWLVVGVLLAIGLALSVMACRGWRKWLAAVKGVAPPTQPISGV
jgi:hypothetical protein